jgi:hypothetical protein
MIFGHGSGINSLNREYGDFISRLTKQQLIELEVYLTQLKSFLDKSKS